VCCVGLIRGSGLVLVAVHACYWLLRAHAVEVCVNTSGQALVPSAAAAAVVDARPEPEASAAAVAAVAAAVVDARPEPEASAAAAAAAAVAAAVVDARPEPEAYAAAVAAAVVDACPESEAPAALMLAAAAAAAVSVPQAPGGCAAAPAALSYQVAKATTAEMSHQEMRGGRESVRARPQCLAPAKDRGVGWVTLLLPPDEESGEWRTLMRPCPLLLFRYRGGRGRCYRCCCGCHWTLQRCSR